MPFSRQRENEIDSAIPITISWIGIPLDSSHLPLFPKGCQLYGRNLSEFLSISFFPALFSLETWPSLLGVDFAVPILSRLRRRALQHWWKLVVCLHGCGRLPLFREICLFPVHKGGFCLSRLRISLRIVHSVLRRMLLNYFILSLSSFIGSIGVRVFEL
jgi:hypothetical protein